MEKTRYIKMQNKQQTYNRFNEQISAFSRIVDKYAPDKSIEKILIYGCGKGDEALTMQQQTRAGVFGVDVIADFSPHAGAQSILVTFDGNELPFDDDIFDLVYSFHVLEHVENVENSLSEIKRVLKSDGVVYVGTPNKARLFGYFGMKDKTWKQKMNANLADWNKRLTGQWENKYGAHAGFNPKELCSLMSDTFGKAVLVTDDYYKFKWPNRKRMVSLLKHTGLDRFLYPSVYVFAKA